MWNLTSETDIPLVVRVCSPEEILASCTGILLVDNVCRHAWALCLVLVCQNLLLDSEGYKLIDKGRR